MSSSSQSTTASLTVSPNFDASDADIFLISSDNVKFAVHKSKLAAHSTVFEDMLEIGGRDGKAKVRMEETAEVLEVVLQYFYPDYVANFDINHPQVFQIIRALDKYQLWRGLESVSRAIQAKTIVDLKSKSGAPKLENAVFRFLFAHRIADTAVAADALNDIKSLAPKIQKLEEIVRLQNEGLFNDDVGRRLVEYFSRRYCLIMESRIEARKAPNTLGYPPTESTGVCYLRLFADWTESASHLAVDDFERFRQELPKNLFERAHENLERTV